MSEIEKQNSQEIPFGEEDTQKTPPKRGVERFGDKVNRNGRPKGSKNKANRDVRESVLKAFDKLGRHEYLMKLANGTVSQQVAFTNLLSKCITKEISGSISHNIIPQLPWLQVRHVDKSDPSDYQSAATAGKSLTDQRVVDGEVIERADGLPLSNPAPSAEGSHD